jgi:hypothetical protein
MGVVMNLELFLANTPMDELSTGFMVGIGLIILAVITLLPALQQRRACRKRLRGDSLGEDPAVGVLHGTSTTQQGQKENRNLTRVA